MAKATKLAIAILATALVFAGVALLAPRPRPVVTGRGGGPPAFQLVPGSARTYDLSLTTRASGAGAEGRETTLEGTLAVRVLAESGGLALAVQLDPLRIRVDGEPQPAMEERYATPFTVAIDPRGRLGASRFPPELAPGDRAVLDGALRAFQVVLPAEPRETWQEVETDNVGAFVASYRTGGGAGGVEKSKARYTSVHPPALFSVQVLASALRAEIGAEGPWLARAEGSERLRLAPLGGVPPTFVEARFRLEATGVPDPSAAIWRDDAVRAARVAVDAPGKAPSAWDDVERERARRRFVEWRVTIDQLVARARTVRGPDAAFARELAAFLRVFPDRAGRLPKEVAQADDGTAALLLHALELAGTPEAQDALADVAESGGQSRDDRIRALVALGGVEAPSAEILDRLGRDARAAGHSDPSGVASTALLALGALAAKAPPEAGRLVVQDLAADLRGTNDPERQRLLLLALENARATLPSDALAPHLASADPAVREAAARVARAAEGGDPTGDLLAALAREANAQVRAGIVAALAARPTDARANTAIASALLDGREPAAAVRVQMVAYLARQRAAFPANREVLRACLPRERDRTVAVAILNALAT